MFERYTEKARRVIFFARYEASAYGSPYIETEHILLGLLREEKKRILQLVPRVEVESIRQQIHNVTERRPGLATSVDLPLDAESKFVLKYACEEADYLGHRHIGTEHLLLGLLRESDCFAAQLLRERGADLSTLREHIRKQISWQPEVRDYSRGGLLSGKPLFIEIHGIPRPSEQILEIVRRVQKLNWHWQKRNWAARDIVLDRKSGKISFDLSLAADAEKFELVKGGWKKDGCAICQWELFESKDDSDHASGYTNGHDWVCNECYDKFWQRREFIGGSYSEIT